MAARSTIRRWIAKAGLTIADDQLTLADNSVLSSGGPGGDAAWGSIAGTLDDQTDLQTALDGKAAATHAHVIADTTGLEGALDGKSATGHAHAPSDITGTAVVTADARLSDARTPTAHSHPQSEVTNLVTDLAAKEPANANIQAHVASAHAPTDAQKNSDITKAEIEAKLTGQISSHTHAGGSEAFPVGSVFIAVVSTNPATLLGYGTWAAFAAGRVLVGIDAGDSDFDTVRETRGAKTHTLQTSEIPAHTHTQDAHTHTQNAHQHNISHVRSATTGGATTLIARTSDTSSTVGADVLTDTATATNQNATATNQDAGGGGAHNNLQPSIVVYMWERTA
jgi:microcystin-dependent protein